ncbi:RNA-binding domain-containing protein [Mesonia ostreae]|uniref:DNA binding domain-containing protein n=1 Tax=Mesonia ostreae TaxID=861110 RepID=A0ABU2KFQ2_9FLAO|nr:RNA-binding domain-containing protein [Mesonia ostreae]MDT0293533.1 putative DNA binding domain-containing protein [Mesonia ostreae]
MTKKELIAKLNDLEWEDFEVKEAKASVPKSCWETVSAFSNTSGGWLVFGIKEIGKSFEIQGVNNPEKIGQDFLNTLRGEKFNVFIDTKQERYTIDDKTVLAFYIPVSAQKPVYYNTQANTFIRRSSSDQKARKNEIDAFYRDQTFGTKTSELASNTSKKDIDTTSLKQYRDYMARFNPDVSYNRFDEDVFLSKLRIVDNNQLTYAGLLFLGKRDTIEKHFPDFRIDLLEIEGKSISEATSTYSFRLGEFENLWDYYFECFKRLKPEVDVAFQLTDQGFGQELSPGLKAIREALVNMLMHADYFAPSHSRIRIFTNHIEFYNPGGLPKPIEELKAKDLSLPRNPLITKLFRMVRLAENAGYGFDRIEANWKTYNNTTPEYDISFDATILKLYTYAQEENKEISDNNKNNFGVTVEKLRRELANQKLNKSLINSILNTGFDGFLEYLEAEFPKTSEKLRSNFGETSEKLRRGSAKNSIQLLMLMESDGSTSAEKASAILAVSSRTVETYIAKLKELNIIKREGSDKLGQWILINDDL